MGKVDLELGCSAILLGQLVATQSARQPGMFLRIKLFHIFYYQIHPVLNHPNFQMDMVKRLAFCSCYLDMSLNWFHLLRANLALLSLMAVPRSNTRTSS